MCAHFLLITRNSLPSSLLSFDVVDETGREGSMACRAERYRAAGGAGRYRAGCGARGEGKFCVHIFC